MKCFSPRFTGLGAAVPAIALLLTLGLALPATAQNVMKIINDNVGVGTDDPKAKMHVMIGGATPFTPVPSTAMVFQNDETVNSGVIFSLIGGTGASANGQINFGNATNEFAGRIVYSFGPNTMRFFANGAERMRVTSSGNLGIGTTAPAGKLDVNGAIFQRGGVVHPDYVFEPDYPLEPIEEHAAYMWENKHLPAVGPGRYDEEGRSVIEVGAHSSAMLEELEKAHIYIAQLNEQLQEERQAKESAISELSARLDRLEALLVDRR